VLRGKSTRRHDLRGHYTTCGWPVCAVKPFFVDFGANWQPSFKMAARTMAPPNAVDLQDHVSNVAPVSILLLEANF